MALKIGYKASAEQFGPRELVDYSVLAEEVGLDSVMISDHFQPWRHQGGHAPFSLSWLAAVGERTSRVLLGTSVMTPTFRYNPAVVAQAFGTLGSLYPGRVMLGVGTGEALNEIVVGSRRARRGQGVARVQGAVRPAARVGHADAQAVDRGAGELRGRRTTRPRTRPSTTSRRPRSRSTSPPADRSSPGMPVAPATGSSAPRARARSSTSTSCSRPSTRVWRSPAAPATTSTG